MTVRRLVTDGDAPRALLRALRSSARTTSGGSRPRRHCRR